MAYHISLLFLTLLFITFICSSNATTFQVGGKDGWTLHPSESYNTWSGRLRFLINDALHFKYDGGSDSVLVVNKGDYDACNSNNPIMKLDGGDSTFKLDRSGPFYFISGNKSNCDQGQKLIVVVLSPRSRSPPTTTPPSPSTLPPTPSSPVATPPGPKSPVLPPSGPEAPVSPPLGPGSPELSPSGTPVLTPPAASPGGGSGSSPTSSPGGGSGPSPASSPGGGSGPSPASSPGGGSESSPTSSPGGGSGSSPASSPGGGSGSSPASSPGGGSGGGASGSSPASSPGGGSGSSAGGGSSPGQAPGGNNPAADVNTPPSPSAATPPLSGSIITAFVTMIFALLCLN